MNTDTQKTSAPVSMIDAALAYAELGFEIFPVYGVNSDGTCACGSSSCSSVGKHPSVRRGVRDATSDPSVIKKWSWKKRNVGLSARNMVIIDLDGELGLKTWSDLIAKHDALPPTPEAETGSGGRHILFAQPAGIKIKNSVRALPGVDTRTEGGYIVVSPSLHKSGRRYRWLTSPKKVPLAVAPKWLISALTKVVPLRGKNKKAKRNATPLRAVPVQPAGGVAELAAKSRLAQAVANVRNAPEGTRNDKLVREAFMIGRRIGAKHLDRAAAKKALVDAARVAGLSAREATATAENGIRAGEKQPINELDDGFSPDDRGNAQRLLHAFGADLRFSAALGWLKHDAKRWARVPDERVLYFAVEVARELADRTETYRAIHGEDAVDAYRSFFKFVARTQSKSGIKAMIELAKADPRVWVDDQELDRDPHLLNVNNGTVCLKSGKLRPHSRSDLITMLAPVIFNPKAKAPRWLAFLDKIFAGKTDVIAFVQRLLGYCATGDVSAHVVIFGVGPGKNGKTTLVSTFMKVLGDYATRGSRFLLVERRHGASDDDAKLVAELHGKRFVAVAESEEGERVAHASLKELSGGDVQRGRFLYKQAFTFKPSAKLLIMTNNKPLIRGGDAAVARRLIMVPFEVVLADSEVDPKLPSKLEGELSGVLNWVIAGALAWQKQGLGTPKEIVDATRSYLRQHDMVAELLRIKFVKDPDGRCERGRVYHLYKECMAQLGEGVMSSRRLYELLRSRGFREPKINGTYFFCGFREPDPIVGPTYLQQQQEDDGDD